mmetsp:Transcript_33871/g.61155  ORF Transcript_33871/g.61155 Transcript_33871/m.61155 type:complete len:823 (+) Transcript_33871:191-2659(+)
MLTGGLAILQRFRQQREVPSVAPAAPSFRIVFAYGSQMGASEEIARNLHAEAVQKLNLKNAEISSLDELKLPSIFPPGPNDGRPYMFLTIVTSSTGDGDPPDNAASFFAALRRKHQEVTSDSSSSKPLDGLFFTLAGLGDSNFNRFMHIPRTIRTRVHELGAQAFHPSIEADDVDGIEESVTKWQESMLPALLKATTAAKEKKTVPTTSPHPPQKPEVKGAAAASKKDNENDKVTEAEGEKAAVAVASILASSNTTSDVTQALGSNTPITTASTPTLPAPLLSTAISAGPSGFPLISGNAIITGVPSVMPAKSRLVIVTDRSLIKSVLSNEENLDGLQNDNDISNITQDSSTSSSSASGPMWVSSRISDAVRFTAPWSDRRVLHVEFEMDSVVQDTPATRYLPGDAISVQPCNDPEEVEALLSVLGVDGDLVFTVERVDGGKGGSEAPNATANRVLPHIPRTCSVRHALSRCLDISGSPQRKSLIRSLAEYASDASEKNTLLFLCSTTKEGRDAFAYEIQKPGPTLSQLLTRFPSCKPPLDLIIDAVPALAPRMYSLTCSPLAHPGRLQVALSVVRFTNKYGNRNGVATSWIDRLTKEAVEKANDYAMATPGNKKFDISKFLPKQRIQIAIRKGGDFRVPEDLSIPIIMIGPGTGVAPFRGFLEHRRVLKMLKEEEGEAGEAVAVGESWLFFGCRREDEDYLYKDDLESFVSDGTLSHLKVAFSRPAPITASQNNNDTVSSPPPAKTYVQHLVAREGAALAKVICEKNGHVFICGDGAHMAKDVHAALEALLVQHRGMTAELASNYLAAMLKAHRYVKDVWS